MKIENISFTDIDWSNIPAVEAKGESGTALTKELSLGNIRLRLLELSPGYKSDHWCSKGHIIIVLEGILITALQDGQTHVTTAANGFVVSDNMDTHRSHTTTGATVIIVD